MSFHSSLALTLKTASYKPHVTSEGNIYGATTLHNCLCCKRRSCIHRVPPSLWTAFAVPVEDTYTHTHTHTDAYTRHWLTTNTHTLFSRDSSLTSEGGKGDSEKRKMNNKWYRRLSPLSWWCFQHEQPQHTLLYCLFCAFLLEFPALPTERRVGCQIPNRRRHTAHSLIKTINTLYESAALWIDTLMHTCVCGHMQAKTSIILSLTWHDTCYNRSAVCAKCQGGL